MSARRALLETALYSLGFFLGFKYIVLPLFLRFAQPQKKKINLEVLQKIAKEKGVQSFTEHEQTIAQCLVNANQLDVDFGCIGGYEKIKQSISEAICIPFKYPNLYANEKSLRKPPKGILLHGPPGVGKTMLCQAIAKECGCTFLNIQREVLGNYLFGESEKLLATVFPLAEKLAPTILFIDEIESMMGSRTNARMFTHEIRQNQLSQFLSYWDGFNSNQSSKIIVVGATNLPESVDPAALRRMPLKIHVPLPTISERENILRVLLRHDRVESNFNFAQVAEKTDKYSGSDLKELCKRALSFPVVEFIQQQKQQHGNTLSSSNSSDTTTLTTTASILAPTEPRPVSIGDFIKAMGSSS